MRKNLTLPLLLCFIVNAMAQNPSTTIATWKNNAKGAYSFIHDDYGDFGVQGINNYADTIARNRGLKFTFGAITSACENNPVMWTDAINMINYGHEIINHSHNHTCAVKRDGWCETGLWAEPSTENFATEMTLSTNLINTKTGTYPRYFIYPYDLFNETANNHLKSLNFIGARTGTYNGAEAANFTPDAQGFFRTALVVEADAGQIPLSSLTKWADYAINNNAWVNREMHNVGTSGWGSISVANYRSHLNYLKSKVTSNDLWVGTISEVLTYQVQKLNYTPTTTYNAGQNQITITWNTPSFNVAQYLQPLTKKSPVTLRVNLGSVSSTGLKVYQNGNEITGVSTTGSIMQFDAYPSNGTITISGQGCPGVCLVSNTSNQTVNENGNATFTFSVTSSNPITYTWYFNNQLIANQNGASLNLSGVKKSQEGTYKVIATANGQSLESSSTLSVLQTSPFNGLAAQIPGTIQFEEFDYGGQNISYYDSSPNNEGDAPLFRSGEVDIEEFAWQSYNVSYVTVGEYLDYTVNVFNSGSYTVNIRNASIFSTGKIKLYMDGVAVSNTLSFTSTGGWQTFTTTSFSNIILSSGPHKLRIEMEGANINLDYIQFVVDNITSANELENKTQFSVFPNPSSSNFTLSLNSSEISEIRILNIEGKTLENIVNPNANLSFGESLSAGVYFVEAVSAKGIERQKVVKK